MILDEGTKSLYLLRQNDSFIMEDFLKAGYQGEELAEMNRCRMYLQVTTLADISTGDGWALWRTALQGQKKLQKSPYGWPPQPDPGRRAWENWEAAICGTYSAHHTLALPAARTLRQWMDNSNNIAWAYLPSEDRAYRRERDK